MKRYNLEVLKNQNFEQEFLYLDKKDGRDFSINIESFEVIWEVKESANATDLLVTDTDYSISNSILKNGYIAIEMTADRTGTVFQDVNSAVWTLYIQDTPNDERYRLAEGTLRIRDWNFHV